MVIHRTRAIALALPLLAALAIGVPSLARAQSSPEQEADNLIEQAKALRSAGDDSAAYQLYLRAYGIARTPRAAGQLALCEFELNRWVDSEMHLQEALRAASDPWVRRNRPILLEMMGKVKLRLGRIEVTGRPEGAEVEVAGRAVGRLPLPGPLRVQAGEIFVRVAAPGYRTWRRTVMVEPEGLASVTVELEPGIPDSPASLLQPPAESDPSRIGRGPPVAELGATPLPASWQRQVGWVGAGMAGALAAAGGVGLLVRYFKTDEFNNYVSDSKKRCNNALSDKGGPTCQGFLDAADQAKTLALVSFAGAGLVGIVSGILLLRSPSSPSGAPASIQVADSGALIGWRF